MTVDMEIALQRAVTSLTDHVHVDPAAGLADLHQTARWHQVRNRAMFVAASVALVLSGTMLVGFRDQGSRTIEMDSSVANQIESALEEPSNLDGPSAGDGFDTSAVPAPGASDGDGVGPDDGDGTGNGDGQSAIGDDQLEEQNEPVLIIETDEVGAEEAVDEIAGTPTVGGRRRSTINAAEDAAITEDSTGARRADANADPNGDDATNQSSADSAGSEAASGGSSNDNNRAISGDDGSRSPVASDATPTVVPTAVRSAAPESLGGSTRTTITSARATATEVSDRTSAQPRAAATVRATTTPRPSATPVPRSSSTGTPAPRSRSTATPTPRARATAIPARQPTAIPTQRPTATPTPRPTAAPTRRPTATPTSRPTATPTPTATATPRPTATPTRRPTATPTAPPRPTATSLPAQGSGPARCSSEGSGPSVVVAWELDLRRLTDRYDIFWRDSVIGTADASTSNLWVPNGHFDPEGDQFSVGAPGAARAERTTCDTGPNGLLPVEPASCSSVVVGDEVLITWDPVPGDAADSYVFYSRSPDEPYPNFRAARAEATERSVRKTVTDPESHVWMVKTRTTLFDGERRFSDGTPCIGNSTGTDLIAGDSRARPFPIGVGSVSHSATTILAETESGETNLALDPDRWCFPAWLGTQPARVRGSVWYEWNSGPDGPNVQETTVQLEADWLAHVAVYRRPSGTVPMGRMADFFIGCVKTNDAESLLLEADTNYLFHVSGLDAPWESYPTSRHEYFGNDYYGSVGRFTLDIRQ